MLNRVGLCKSLQNQLKALVHSNRTNLRTTATVSYCIEFIPCFV